MKLDGPHIVLEPAPFDEAIEYFGSRIPMTAERFATLSAQAQATAFMVGGVARMDLVEGIHGAVLSAIESGETLADFRGRVDDLFASQGFASGEESLGAWRMETIFRTNVQTAYNVGRHEQLEGMKEDFPYWEYDAVNDGNTRPEHAALDGKVFPADHPFWDTWYPPNGYNCFPACTEVRTASGWRPIETIKINDRIIGGSGEEQRVSFIHKNLFNGNMVRLRSENSLIDATPNHRILTMRGWVRAKDLEAGDILVETIKQASIDAPVGDVNKANAEIGNGTMPLPVQRKSAIALTSDAQIKLGNKNIQPSRTGSRRNNLIVDWTKTKILNVIEHKSFRSRGRSLACGVTLGISPHDESVGSGVFGSDFRPSGRRGFLKFKRGAHGAWIDLFGLSFSRMISGAFHLGAQFFHSLRCFFSSFFWSMQPLCANGRAAFPRIDPEMPEEAHQGSGVNAPADAELPVRKLFDDVKPSERFEDGAPLDRYNTLDDFRAWARSHCCLRKIILVGTIPYNDTVYNLSVDNDETYIVPGATVHNCRCGVLPVHKIVAEEEGLKIETDDPTGKLIEPIDAVGNKLPARPLMPDSGFATNPAKQPWTPDLEKYPDELVKQYREEEKTR